MSDKHSLRNSYPCNLVINNWKLINLEISQYYKTRPGREMINDEMIIKMVESLNHKRLIPDAKKNPSSWDYFTLKAVRHEDKFYRLICCHENNSSIWGIVNIYPITIKDHEKTKSN